MRFSLKRALNNQLILFSMMLEPNPSMELQSQIRLMNKMFKPLSRNSNSLSIEKDLTQKVSSKTRIDTTTSKCHQSNSSKLLFSLELKSVMLRLPHV